MITTRSRCHGSAKKGKIEAYMMIDGRKELENVHFECCRM
jgi:hypothetical protein